MKYIPYALLYTLVAASWNVEWYKAAVLALIAGWACFDYGVGTGIKWFSEEMLKALDGKGKSDGRNTPDRS